MLGGKTSGKAAGERGASKGDKAPGGENSWDNYDRIAPFIDKIIENHEGTVLLVAHSGTNKVIIGHLMGREPPNFYDIEQKNCCINLISLEEGEVNFKVINKSEHL